MRDWHINGCVNSGSAALAGASLTSGEFDHQHAAKHGKREKQLVLFGAATAADYFPDRPNWTVPRAVRDTGTLKPVTVVVISLAHHIPT